MIGLGGKTAVVTGAASGIGLAMAKRFGAEGMHVVLADIEERALDEAVGEVGGDAVGVVTDVSKGDDVDALRVAALDAFGAVHVVCNNAGVGGGGPMQALTTADWEWVLGVNLWGVIHGVRAFLPLLLEQGEGHIVNTASMAGLTTAPMMGPYTVSKHGVVALSETLVKELGMQGSKVGVSVLCPGWVNTRIAESDRNRPVELGGAGPGAESPLASLLRGLLESGLKPDEVAGHVVDGVRDSRFYILTHPEMAPAIEERMQDILQGRTPGMMGSGISALFNQG